jgi:outer membrane lipase/esterase
MKRKMAMACLAMLMMSTTAFAGYEQLYIFGDSLSDSGAYAGNADAGAGQRFTTDPGLVWVENLGLVWGVPVTANNPNNPVTDADGNNYAQGGAQVSSPIGIGSTPSPQAAQSITTQLQTYLGEHAGGDSNALYIVWGGANDVFYNAQLAATGTPTEQISANLLASATELNGVIQTLAQFGAKVILVPLLPDIGKTPATIMTAIQTVGAGNSNLTTALGAAAIALAQPGATPADQQAVRDAAMTQADTVLGVPAGTVAATEQIVAAGFSDMSDGFNFALKMWMSSGDANVVPMDVAGFLSAATADPASFGLVNVTGFACGVSALPCAPGTYVPGTEEVFLFADPVHPTTGIHKAIADYAFSILSAPGLASTLPDVAIASERTSRIMMDSQMKLASQVEPDTWVIFANGSYQPMEGNTSNGIPSWEADETGGMLGAIYRARSGWSVGFSLGKSQSDIDWGNDSGGFDYTATFGMVSLRHQGEMFNTNLTGGFGISDYEIGRQATIRSATRTNIGGTDGNQIILAVSGEADLWRTDMGTFGPVYGLAYQKAYVDAYAESGDNFDSIGYSRQSRDSLIAELGVFSELTVTDNITLDLSLVRELEMSGDKITPDAYLTSLPNIKFNLPGTDADDGYWRAGVQINSMLSDNVAISATYNYRKGDDYESSSLFNLGMQMAF